MPTSAKDHIETETKKAKELIQRKFDAGVTDPMIPMMVFTLKGHDKRFVGVLHDVPDEYALRLVVLSLFGFNAARRAMEEVGMSFDTKFPVESVAFIAEAYLKKSKDDKEKMDGLVVSVITKAEPKEFIVSIPFTVDGKKVSWGEENRDVEHISLASVAGKSMSPAMALLTGANMTDDDIERGVEKGIIPKGLLAAIKTVSIDMSSDRKPGASKLSVSTAE